MGGKLSRVGQMVQIGEVVKAREAAIAADRAFRAQCVLAMESGCTGAEVAEAVGVSRATLYRLLDS
jgi:hypothetical protein